MLTFAGCGPDGRDDGALPTPEVATSGGSTGSDESEASELDPLDDLPTPPATGVDPDAESGCEKIDFLFVIDHSGSMESEQQALIDSFPGFIEAIEDRVGHDGTFHILVTDVDAWVWGACESEGCVDAAQCEADSPTGICDCGWPCAMRDLCTAGDYVCGQTDPMACEDVLGAGVTHPRGRGATSHDCAFASGARFIDGSEPDVASAFGCAAQVGTGSSNPELPIQAMVEALSPQGAVADCNQGFLRDDALLVVTLITDEDDNGPGPEDPVGDSPGDPSAWFDALAAAKGGNAEGVVFLGLIGDNNQPGGICTPLDHAAATGAEDCPRVRELAALFGPRGHVASVCAPSYDGFFIDAVESIGQACEDFVPEG